MDFNEKAFADTLQVLNISNDRDKIKELLSRADIDERLKNIGFTPGKEIFIKAIVRDRFFSSIITDMIYGKSKIDDGPMHALGIEIQQISWDGVAYFSQQEIEILKSAAEIINKIQTK